MISLIAFIANPNRLSVATASAIRRQTYCAWAAAAGSGGNSLLFSAEHAHNRVYATVPHHARSRRRRCLWATLSSSPPQSYFMSSSASLSLYSWIQSFVRGGGAASSSPLDNDNRLTASSSAAAAPQQQSSSRSDEGVATTDISQQRPVLDRLLDTFPVSVCAVQGYRS